MKKEEKTVGLPHLERSYSNEAYSRFAVAQLPTPAVVMSNGVSFSPAVMTYDLRRACNAEIFS